MFKRLSILPLLAILLSLPIPNFAYAGSSAPSTVVIAATTSTSIEAGGSDTFSVTYQCNGANPSGWSATVQLINDTNGTPLGSPQTVTWSPQVQNAGLVIPTETATIALTFSQPGTYPVGVDITSEDDCQTSSIAGAPINVTVAAAATTTAAPTTTTTTVAPMTTEKEKLVLPATGSDNTGLFIAVGTALAGATILISRRRLLSQ